MSPAGSQNTEFRMNLSISYRNLELEKTRLSRKGSLVFSGIFYAVSGKKSYTKILIHQNDSNPVSVSRHLPSYDGIATAYSFR